MYREGHPLPAWHGCRPLTQGEIFLLNANVTALSTDVRRALFRTTASTVLNEQQFNRDWIAMQLAHFDGSVRGVYNAAEWLPGRREIMCWWSAFVDDDLKRRKRAD